ncbi:MAG TPA: TlpA family protein disulfide reductase [Peptococcaceae bacterium]|nr:TlpA family protein disulfide reductase [Peptococcaceae bacterium]
MLNKKSSQTIFIFYLALLTLLLTLSGCSGVSKGSEAPDFTLTNIEGKRVSLSDLRGKNVFLNFWASWCEPCKDEMPDLEQIWQEYQERDLVVLTVNTGESQETVKKYIEENGYTFQVLLDSNLTVARLYNTSNIPASFFINKEGIVIEKKEGFMSGADMKKAVGLLYQ